MLAPADNRMISEVSQGTPMGEYLRNFWMPILRSETVTAGGDPVRARVVGESLVVYRLNDGTLGCLDELCPHRRASLALGYNSGESLSCIYHGWKFGKAGSCIDVPTEPPNRRERFRAALPVNSHPVTEAGGIIWAYMGKGEPPELPALDFMGLPADQCYATVGITNAGWVQCLEGLVDTAHLGQLHQTQFPGQDKVAYEAAPTIILRDSPYGLRVCADRPKPNGGHYYRITEYLAPYWVFVPQSDLDDKIGFGIVPIDDTHTMQWAVWYNRNRPTNPQGPLGSQFQNLLRHPDDYTHEMRGKKLWGQDRDTLGRGHFSGLSNLFFEDLAVQESQGAIMDREHEHLGSSDVGVVRLRRTLKTAATRFAAEDSSVFNGVGQNDLSRICGTAFESESDDWENALTALHDQVS